VIKKHEKTRKDKEDDRATHVITLKANTGPVFILYPDQNQINQLIADEMGKTPEVSFTSMDGIQHTVRVIRDAVVMQKLVGAFKEKVPTMYIADGHHRAASGSRARQTFKKQGTLTSDSAANYFMAVLFPASQLQILAYNRVVKDLNGLSPEDFLARVKEKFEVKEREEAPELKAGSFGMYLNKKWLLLSAKKGSFDAANVMKSLDVSILQDNLLGPTLGIDDPRTNKRIDFVGGIRGTAELMRLVDSGKAAVAFSLHPTTVKQLMAISDQGLIMPPKSTWFEPKLKSGLFLHRFE